MYHLTAKPCMLAIVYYTSGVRKRHAERYAAFIYQLTFSRFYFLVCITGFRKKVRALAKQKDCELIGEYDQPPLLVCSVNTKWRWKLDASEMVENHIHNKHSGHGRPFSKCSHGRLLGRNRERELNGVVPASTAFCVASTSLTAVFNRIRP